MCLPALPLAEYRKRIAETGLGRGPLKRHPLARRILRARRGRRRSPLAAALSRSLGLLASGVRCRACSGSRPIGAAPARASIPQARCGTQRLSPPMPYCHLLARRWSPLLVRKRIAHRPPLSSSCRAVVSGQSAPTAEQRGARCRTRYCPCFAVTGLTEARAIACNCDATASLKSPLRRPASKPNAFAEKPGDRSKERKCRLRVSPFGGSTSPNTENLRVPLHQPFPACLRRGLLNGTSGATNSQNTTRLHNLDRVLTLKRADHCLCQ